MSSKKIKCPNTVKVRYRIYKNENGLLLEPQTYYDDRIFIDFDSLEDAVNALERYEPIYAEFVVLPILDVKIKE